MPYVSIKVAISSPHKGIRVLQVAYKPGEISPEKKG
jgi:hypothetical protein